MDTTVYDDTGFNPDTSIDTFNEKDFFPPMSIIYDEDGRASYKPVNKSVGNWDYQADVIQYTCDGKPAGIGIRISVDGSRNMIDNRFEILDLEKEEDDI